MDLEREKDDLILILTTFFLQNQEQRKRDAPRVKIAIEAGMKVGLLPDPKIREQLEEAANDPDFVLMRDRDITQVMEAYMEDA